MAAPPKNLAFSHLGERDWKNSRRAPRTLSLLPESFPETARPSSHSPSSPAGKAACRHACLSGRWLCQCEISIAIDPVAPLIALMHFADAMTGYSFESGAGLRPVLFG